MRTLSAAKYPLARQDLLVLETARPNPDSETLGQSLYIGGVEQLGEWNDYPINALRKGWRLLGPPMLSDGSFDWWFERDVASDLAEKRDARDPKAVRP